MTTPVAVDLIDRATRDRARRLDGIDARGPELLPLEAGEHGHEEAADELVRGVNAVAIVDSVLKDVSNGASQEIMNGDVITP